MNRQVKAEASKLPWWALVVFIIVAVGIISWAFGFAQDVVDKRATRCEALMERLSDPEITVGEVERARIENADCYPSEWGWPGLLRPQPKEKRR